MNDFMCCNVLCFAEKILLPGEVRINILNPIPTQGLDDTNVNELAEKTRQIMLETFEKDVKP